MYTRLQRVLTPRQRIVRRRGIRTVPESAGREEKGRRAEQHNR